MVYEVINKYYSDINTEKNQRYRSWEHCYTFFRNHMNIITEEQKDHAALNLAFYLASWGMYRGSSFLLQKDYKVHKYAVDVLLSDKYKGLWQIEFTSEDILKRHGDLLFELKEDVIAAYVDNIDVINGIKKRINVTDTLVTKILLGTIGHAPAYDRYFVNGLKYHGFRNLAFDKKSYLELIRFYMEHKDEFDDFQEKTRKDGLEYSIMKLIDMYFWQIGFSLDSNDENKELVVLNKKTEEKDLVHKPKASINNDEMSATSMNIVGSFNLPDNFKGRKITEKIIPTVYNLKNLLEKLREYHGDISKLKPWELRSYQGYNLEHIKSEIIYGDRNNWIEIIKNHILKTPISNLGAHVMDIYLIAYASQNYGVGKEIFFNYLRDAGVTEKTNSMQAIWTVGRGDGVFLGILNDDGSVRDWDFIRKWVLG